MGKIVSIPKKHGNPMNLHKDGKLIHQKADQRLQVVWEGSQFVYHSLALVNRELCLALAHKDEIDLSLIPYERHQFDASIDSNRFQSIADRLNRPLPGPPHFHIRHQWPPNFEPPPAGYWIMIQPWEYGALPETWVAPMQTLVDEIWVPSSFVRNTYIQSGIPADKVQIIPNGVNHRCFNSDAPAHPLATQKRFKFLFVGGTIWRKGIDILLEAYTQAFSAGDDVCLIIKDSGGGSFYQGQNAAALIQQAQNDVNAPEICHLTEDLTEAQVAGLYTACDCLVHPYRGEGFGLPVAEAMACGLPVIVTRGGACDDFCSEDAVFFVDSARRRSHLTGHQLISPGWVLEPDQQQLIQRLKDVYENSESAARKGELAAAQIRNTLSWQQSADLIIERLTALRNQPICRFGTICEDRPNFHQGGNAVKTTEEMYQDIRPLMENEWHEAAINALGKLLESDPDFGPAHGDLGALYYKLGDKDKAVAHYEKAALLEPDNTPVLKALADMYYVEEGKIEEALKIYRAVLEGSPNDVATLMTAGHLSVASQKFDEAKGFYDRILEVEPWNGEARQYLDKLTEMNAPEVSFESAEQWYQTLQSQADADQPEKLIADLENLIQSYPEFAPAHNDLGVLYYQHGDKDKTLVHYEKAAELEPNNLILKKNLADYYCIEQGRLEDALALYIGVLKIEPEDLETLLSLGHICAALGKNEDAEVFFKRVLDIEPWNLAASEGLKSLATEPPPEIPPEASADSPADSPAELPAEAPADSADEMYRRIQGQISDQTPEQVCESLENLLQSYPDFALAHNDLGVLCYNAGHKDKALDHYEAAARLDPDSITFRKNLADFYYVEQGRVEEALRIYVGILETNPEDVETLLITGHICVSLKNFEDAKVFYNRVLEIEPWNEDARDALEALKMSQKAG